MKAAKRRAEWQDLGRVRYAEAWRFQEELRLLRQEGRIPDRLLLLEHDPVITQGKRGIGSDILASEEILAREGIELFCTNRGGRATYHGPGQVVGYFIFDIQSAGSGPKEFVRAIESMLMDAVGRFGISAARDEAHPGLWVRGSKIAAIGLNISRGVTQHGFALNVSCDLKPYRHIVACGLSDRGVTTMERETGLRHAAAEVKEALISAASRAFSCEFVRLEIPSLM